MSTPHPRNSAPSPPAFAPAGSLAQRPSPFNPETVAVNIMPHQLKPKRNPALSPPIRLGHFKASAVSPETGFFGAQRQNPVSSPHPHTNSSNPPSSAAASQRDTQHTPKLPALRGEKSASIPKKLSALPALPALRVLRGEKTTSTPKKLSALPALRGEKIALPLWTRNTQHETQ